MVKIFYRGYADGKGSAFLVSKYKSKAKKQFFELDYSKPFPIDKISKGDEVFIVDYSFTDKDIDLLRKVNSIAGKLVWIDHHKTSIELCFENTDIDNIRGVREESLSATAMCYMYFTGIFNFDDLPDFVRYISDADTNHELEESGYFVTGLESYEYGPEDKIWNELIDGNLSCNEVIKKGKIIEEYNIHNNKDYLLKYGYVSNIKGHDCITVNRKCDDDLFDSVKDKYDLCASVWFHNGVYNYSIFKGKKSDIDCCELFKEYGAKGKLGEAEFMSKQFLLKEKGVK